MAQYRILTNEKDVSNIASAWCALHKKTSQNFFATYECYDVWWQTIGKAEKSTPHIVTEWDGSTLTGLLALTVRYKGGVRLLSRAGSDYFVGALSLFSCTDSLKNLWAIAAQSHAYDVAEIKSIFDETPEKEIVESLPTSTCVEKSVMTFARYNGMPSTEWEKTLNNSMRKDLRRRLRSFEEQGQMTYVVHREKPPAHIVCEMMRNKFEWFMHADLDYDILFASGDLMPRLIDAAAQTGHLTLVSMEYNGKTIAQDLCFASGKIQYGYMTAYDPDFSKASPGNQATLFSMSWAADHGFDEYNFMLGKEPYKARFTNGEEPVLFYSFHRTWRGFVVRHFLALRQSAKLRPLLEWIKKAAVKTSAESQTPTNKAKSLSLSLHRKDGSCQNLCAKEIRPSAQNKVCVNSREADLQEQALYVPFDTTRFAFVSNAHIHAPTDILFIGRDQTITKIVENVPALSAEKYGSEIPINAVILLRGGFCAQAKISPQDTLSFSNDDCAACRPKDTR